MAQLVCRLVEDFVRNSLAPCVIYFMNQSQEKANPFPSSRDPTTCQQTGELSELPETHSEQGWFFLPPNVARFQGLLGVNPS